MAFELTEALGRGSRTAVFRVVDVAAGRGVIDGAVGLGGSYPRLYRLRYPLLLRVVRRVFLGRHRLGLGCVLDCMHLSLLFRPFPKL